MKLAKRCGAYRRFILEYIVSILLRLLGYFMEEKERSFYCVVDG